MTAPTQAQLDKHRRNLERFDDWYNNDAETPAENDGGQIDSFQKITKDLIGAAAPYANVTEAAEAAEAARDDAQLAQQAGEQARDQAQVAQQSAEAARDEAEGYAGELQSASQAMTRAEFEARAAAARDLYAGSGFIEWGKHLSSNPINTGMFASNGFENVLSIGRGQAAVGDSRSEFPVLNAYGMRLAVRNSTSGVNQGDVNYPQCNFYFPPAPNTSALLSRQDLAFIEVWVEKITGSGGSNDVYPDGNVQASTTSWNGIALSQPRPASYSAHGQWEVNAGTPVAGYGAVWDSLTADQQAEFIRDPDNNIFVDEGELYQTRYRIRVAPGQQEEFEFFDVHTASLAYAVDLRVRAQGKADAVGDDTVTGTSGPYYAFAPEKLGLWEPDTQAQALSDGEGPFAIPIALVQRRNQGAYHPTYNAEGCAKLLNLDGTTDAFWYDTDRTINSTQDCFDFATGGDIASGISGRADGLYYDQIASRDVLDLRMSAHRVEDMDRLQEREFQRLVAGEQRGWEPSSRIIYSQAVSSVTRASNAPAGFKLRLTDSEDSLGVVRDEWNPDPVFLTDVGENGGLPIGFAIDSAGTPFAVTTLRQTASDYELQIHFRHGSNPAVFDVSGSVHLVFFGRSSSQSATLTQCDIIGDPANYPAEWATDGVAGQPLLVDPNDFSVSQLPADVAIAAAGDPVQERRAFLLSRVNAKSTPQLVLKWDGVQYHVIGTGNAGTPNGAYLQAGFADSNSMIIYGDWTNQTNVKDTDVFMVFYETAASGLETAPRGDVIRPGEVFATANAGEDYGVGLINHLVGRIGVSSGATSVATVGPPSGYVLNADAKFIEGDAYPLSHGPLPLDSIGPGAKFAPHLSAVNNRLALYLHFQELLHDGVDYGDSGEIEPYSDVRVVTDDNGAAVLTGVKRLPLNHFILDGE